MNCPACKNEMVMVRATDHGDEYPYCRTCKKELSEIQQPARKQRPVGTEECAGPNCEICRELEAVTGGKAMGHDSGRWSGSAAQPHTLPRSAPFIKTSDKITVTLPVDKKDSCLTMSLPPGMTVNAGQLKKAMDFGKNYSVGYSLSDGHEQLKNQFATSKYYDSLADYGKLEQKIIWKSGTGVVDEKVGRFIETPADKPRRGQRAVLRSANGRIQYLVMTFVPVAKQFHAVVPMQTDDCFSFKNVEFFATSEGMYDVQISADGDYFAMRKRS